MKFQDYLAEEYITRVKGEEVFKNPTRKEYLSISKNGKEAVRVLWSKKDIWIFPYSVLHKYVEDQVKNTSDATRITFDPENKEIILPIKLPKKALEKQLRTLIEKFLPESKTWKLYYPF